MKYLKIVTSGDIRYGHGAPLNFTVGGAMNHDYTTLTLAKKIMRTKPSNQRERRVSSRILFLGKNIVEPRQSTELLLLSRQNFIFQFDICHLSALGKNVYKGLIGG